MTYPFVAAAHFTRGGMEQPRAIVIHMAEGTGTVSWLTHPYTIVNGVKKPQDNSSHYVIETSGRIVQMVHDADAAHSLHWDTAHWSASTCGGTFDDDVARALLGSGSSDPNAYLFAIECEGHAADGPNAKQFQSLHALIADLRDRHPSLRGLLGHRDFQGYKGCPGCKVFNVLQHGKFDVTQAAITDQNARLVTTAANSTWYDVDGKTVLSTGHTALAERISPYGCGTLRAIFATVNTVRRIVLIKPATMRAVPAPVAVPDAAMLAAKRTEGFNDARDRAAAHVDGMALTIHNLKETA